MSAERLFSLYSAGKQVYPDRSIRDMSDRNVVRFLGDVSEEGWGAAITNLQKHHIDKYGSSLKATGETVFDLGFAFGLVQLGRLNKATDGKVEWLATAFLGVLDLIFPQGLGDQTGSCGGCCDGPVVEESNMNIPPEKSTDLNTMPHFDPPTQEVKHFDFWGRQID